MTRHPTDRASLVRDCDVEFLRGSGPGGQHRNKTESGVRMVHRPTGLMVMATERRSQSANLDAAYDRMARKLDELQRPVIPRRPTRPSMASKRRRLEEKRQRGQTKAGRRSPDEG